jgi:hypothetical protein
MSVNLPKIVDFEFGVNWLRLEVVTPEAAQETVYLGVGENTEAAYRYKGIGHSEVGLDRVPQEYWLHIEKSDGTTLLYSVVPENPSDFHERFFMRR